jgi:hypothetical protein
LNYTTLANATVAAWNATTTASPSPLQDPATGAPTTQAFNASGIPHPMHAPSPLSLNDNKGATLDTSNATAPSPLSLNRTNATTLDPSNSTAPVRSGLTLSPTVPLARESQNTTISKPNHVFIRNFFIAYRAPDAQTAPSALEFEEMRKRTEIYYSAFLASMFANYTFKFEGLQTQLNATAFGKEASRPTDNFNIYTQYQYADIMVDVESQPLSAEETFEILKSGITVEYILQVVRTMAHTPFESTTEVFMSSA